MVSCQKQVVIITIVCLFWFEGISTQDGDQYCKLSILHQCGPNETCEQRAPNNDTGVCTCVDGYRRAVPDGECILVNPTPSPEPVTASSPPSDDPSSAPVHYDSSHIVLGVMIPLALISLALGAVYAAQRFQWVQKIRAMRQRRYDEVQFGQDDDDPPLA